MRRWLPAGTLLVLTLTTLALPGSSAQGPSVTMAAFAAGDGIQVEVDLQGATDRDVVIAVTHTDGGGVVVDRLAPLHVVAPGTRALVQGLRPASPVTVRVLEGPLASYLGAYGEVDAAAVAAAPSLAPPVAVTTPGAGVPLPTQLMAARRVDNESGGGIRLLELPDGRVAAAWSTWSASDFSHLRMALSSDGGRTFGPPVTISTRINPDRQPWSWGLDADGSLVFVVSEWAGPRTAPVPLPATTLLRYDPVNATVTTRDLADGLRLQGWSDLELDATGRLLLLAMGSAADQYLVTPQMWNVSDDQPATLLRTFEGLPGSAYYSKLDLEISGSHALVMWDVYDPVAPDANASIQVSRSTDGGRTFGPTATPALGPNPAAPDGHLELDASGTGHLALLSVPRELVNGSMRYDYSNATNLYARFPADGSAPVLRALSGPGNTVFPTSERSGGAWVAVDGAHVWILLEDYRRITANSGQMQTLAVESQDGGTTFQAPWRPSVRGGFAFFVEDLFAIRGRAQVANQGIESAQGSVRHFVSAPLLSEPLPTEGQLLQTWPKQSTTTWTTAASSTATATAGTSTASDVSTPTETPAPHPTPWRTPRRAFQEHEPPQWNVTSTTQSRTTAWEPQEADRDDDVVVVPPVALGLVLAGLAGLAAVRRRL